MVTTYYFFFSSRRRHTRFDCDWSSDVCSSDLGRDPAYLVRENARLCGVWKSLYERWQNGSRQRYNTAALNFDPVATRYVIQAENEALQSRDYAVRQLKQMRFPKMRGGANLEELTVKGINIAIRNLYEHHLSPA